MKLVTVFTTLNPAEADLVRSELEAAEFDVMIANEFSAQTLPSAATAGGLKVQVPEDQATDARELIDATINSKETPPDEASAS